MPDVVLPLPSKDTIRKFALKALICGFALYMIYVVREIWLPLSLALILAMVLDPVVDRMEARGWSRTWAAAFIFCSFVLIAAGLIVLATPYIVNQASGMQIQFEKYFPDHSKAGLLKSFHQMNVPDGIAQLAAQSFGSLTDTAPALARPAETGSPSARRWHQSSLAGATAPAGPRHPDPAILPR